jgi:HlyD family secretion protein
VNPDPLLDVEPPSRSRWLWPAVIAALALAGGGVYWARKGSSEPAIRFETVQVSRGPVIAKVTATGVLSALVTVEVGSQVSGRIAELTVDYNSPVQKGQVIARIDPQLFKAALEQARANALSAAAAVAKARAEASNSVRQLGRSRQLREQNLIAQADLDSADAASQAAAAQVQAAEAQLAQAKAQRNTAELNLHYTEIVAPVSGTVISRNVSVGQTVAASLQAPILFTIAEDLRRMQVDTSVAEADVGKLQPGMKATFSVDAYPGERFEGTIRQIRNAAQTVQNVVTYDAVIDVANPELKLRPGMTANVTFVYAERSNVLRLPNTALRFRPTPDQLGEPAASGSTPRRAAPASGRVVYRLEGGRPVAASVETGVSDGTLTELLGGALNEGDGVVTSAQSSSGGGGGGATFPGGPTRMRGPRL